MNKLKVEAEGQELIIQSTEGHYAIIPKKDRDKIKKMILDKCDNCINNYIQTLPKVSNYISNNKNSLIE
jgi:hypothetical protein